MKPAAFLIEPMPAPQLYDSGPHNGGNTTTPFDDWPCPSAPWHSAHFCSKVLAPRLKSIASAGFGGVGYPPPAGLVPTGPPLARKNAYDSSATSTGSPSGGALPFML